jgi:signal transduction histidine kinase
VRDEEARLAAVRRYDILDTPPDGAFDRVTALAARLFGVPIAIISIVDGDRIWFKSHHGTEVDQIGREPGLYTSAVMQTDAFARDESLDPQLLSDPLVAGEHGFRFYAAAPLISPDGFNLGTLCVIDRQPRTLSEREIATLEDLAAIVIDELELRHAARSEEQRLEQVRADFTATVSHELKTPLAAVYGAALTVARTDDAVDEETRRRLLTVIAEQGERLRSMFENVLSTTQLESGSFRIVSRDLHPAELAHSAAEAARAHLPPTVTIEVDIDGKLPTACIDTTRVRQILENLLDNAVKYSPKDGRIELRVAADSETVRFHVRDQGPGIPESERDRIFRRYYRLDPDLHAGISGTGLGLYVCQQLATHMGGRIELDTRERHGSTFTLALPLHRSAE